MVERVDWRDDVLSTVAWEVERVVSGMDVVVILGG